jgi:DNA-binding YbaB/EbfC family protein
MFKELGQFASLMKNLPRIKEEMAKLQGKMAQISAEGDAGGGMVKVRVNGNMEVVACSFSDEAIKGGDKELLEDLTTAAVNQAMKKAKELVAEETAKMATGLGMPPGMGLPGME